MLGRKWRVAWCARAAVVAQRSKSKGDIRHEIWSICGDESAVRDLEVVIDYRTAELVSLKS